MAPPPYRTLAPRPPPEPRPPPTRKSEVAAAWISALLVGGSLAVILPTLPYSLYIPPIGLLPFVIPALRAKALNPKSSLLGYLIWIGFSVWAVVNIPWPEGERPSGGERLNHDGWMWLAVACIEVLASLPLVFMHWAAFRRLQTTAKSQAGEG